MSYATIPTGSFPSLKNRAPIGTPGLSSGKGSAPHEADSSSDFPPLEAMTIAGKLLKMARRPALGLDLDDVTR